MKLAEWGREGVTLELNKNKKRSVILVKAHYLLFIDSNVAALAEPRRDTKSSSDKSIVGCRFIPSVQQRKETLPVVTQLKHFTR